MAPGHDLEQSFFLVCVEVEPGGCGPVENRIEDFVRIARPSPGQALDECRASRVTAELSLILQPTVLAVAGVGGKLAGDGAGKAKSASQTE